MADTRLSVRSQIIPIGGGHLVLPNTAVAEVINYSEPAPIAEGPEWLLGLLSWRERDVPLLSFEVMCGQPKPPVPVRAKIVVLNALGGNPDLNFFAVLVQGIPQLANIDESRIAAMDYTPEADSAILSRVVVDGETAVIPDLDGIEQRLLDCKKKWFKAPRERRSANNVAAKS